MAFPPLVVLATLLCDAPAGGFEIVEATIGDIHEAFRRGELTSRALVEFYLGRIRDLNPLLHAVIEVNPDALRQADAADERWRSGVNIGTLHGIPVLLKDNIATVDAMDTTAGSLALVGSVAPRDAGVVAKLRSAGAVMLGKANLTEWCGLRSLDAPSGWSARGGQAKNPYNLSENPNGSSSGSAIAAAANMVAVTLASETNGSILSPACANSVVGIKPTVGLTSRSGVITISPRHDTIGPICRSVSDAVRVLDAIVGYDPLDSEATKKASRFIPPGGYTQSLKVDGLRGKRLGIPKQFFDFVDNADVAQEFEKHISLLRQQGAVVLDNLEIENASTIQGSLECGEAVATIADFKISINRYLTELSSSSVRSLRDIINFNNNNREQERMDEFGQEVFLKAQDTDGVGPYAIQRMSELSEKGLEKLMKEKKLDAVVLPGMAGFSLLAIGGYPGISVPAGYRADGSPFGINFGGLKGSERVLVEIAYGFEQATMIRKPPILFVLGK